MSNTISNHFKFDKVKFANSFSELLRKKEMSLRDCSEIVNLKHITIHRICKGNKANPDTIATILKCFPEMGSFEDYISAEYLVLG